METWNRIRFKMYQYKKAQTNPNFDISLPTSKFSKPLIKPIEVGIEPVISFSPKEISCKLASSPSSDGRVPLILLLASKITKSYY